MRNKPSLLIMLSFLASMGWMSAASAGVCFTVGFDGDCADGQQTTVARPCSEEDDPDGLGYNETVSTCNGAGDKLDGKSCSYNGEKYYKKCICDPNYYRYSQDETSKYDYSDICTKEGDASYGKAHIRTCKTQFKYPSNMSNGITQGSNQCDKKADSYNCPSGYSKTGDKNGGYHVRSSAGSGYEANCYKALTCDDYDLISSKDKSDYDDSTNGGFKCSSSSKKIGSEYGTCWSCTAKTCSDHMEGGVTLSGNSCSSGHSQTSYTKYLGFNQGTCYKCAANTCSDYSSGTTIYQNPGTNCGNGYIKSTENKLTGNSTSSCVKCTAKTCSSYNSETVIYWQPSSNCSNAYIQSTENQLTGNTTTKCTKCTFKTCSDYIEGGITLQAGTCPAEYASTSYVKTLGNRSVTCYKCSKRPCEDFTFRASSYVKYYYSSTPLKGSRVVIESKGGNDACYKFTKCQPGDLISKDGYCFPKNDTDGAWGWNVEHNFSDHGLPDVKHAGQRRAGMVVSSTTEVDSVDKTKLIAKIRYVSITSEQYFTRYFDEYDMYSSTGSSIGLGNITNYSLPSTYKRTTKAGTQVIKGAYSSLSSNWIAVENEMIDNYGCYGYYNSVYNQCPSSSYAYVVGEDSRYVPTSVAQDINFQRVTSKLWTVADANVVINHLSDFSDMGGSVHNAYHQIALNTEKDSNGNTIDYSAIYSRECYYVQPNSKDITQQENRVRRVILDPNSSDIVSASNFQNPRFLFGVHLYENNSVPGIQPTGVGAKRVLYGIGNTLSTSSGRMNLLPTNAESPYQPTRIYPAFASGNKVACGTVNDKRGLEKASYAFRDDTAYLTDFYCRPPVYAKKDAHLDWYINGNDGWMSWWLYSNSGNGFSSEGYDAIYVGIDSEKYGLQGCYAKEALDRTYPHQIIETYGTALAQ